MQGFNSHGFAGLFTEWRRHPRGHTVSSVACDHVLPLGCLQTSRAGFTYVIKTEINSTARLKSPAKTRSSSRLILQSAGRACIIRGFWLVIFSNYTAKAQPCQLPPRPDKHQPVQAHLVLQFPTPKKQKGALSWTFLPVGLRQYPAGCQLGAQPLNTQTSI